MSNINNQGSGGGGGTTLDVGVTPIINGAANQFLFDNGGTLEEGSFGTGLSFSGGVLSATAVGANPSATAGPNAINGVATTFMRSDAAPAIQLGSNSQKGIVEVDGTTITATSGVISAALPTGANPSATAGPSAVNGSATTFMRSDGAPAVQLGSATQKGIVQVDNTTITASGGVISAVGGSGGLTVGTTTIAGGAAGQFLYDNGGTLEESVGVTYISTADDVGIKLDATGISGEAWQIHSTGSADPIMGADVFAIVEGSTSDQLGFQKDFLFGYKNSTGNYRLGIGSGIFFGGPAGLTAYTPACALDIRSVSDGTNNTLILSNDNINGCALTLNSKGTGCKEFQFFSTGTGNGPGRFGVYNGTDNNGFYYDCSGTNPIFAINAVSAFGWSPQTAVPNAGDTDTTLGRNGAAGHIIAGGVPVAGTNQTATGLTLANALSTGNATNPDLVFQTGTKTLSGATQATPTTALTIKGETQAVMCAGDLYTNDASFLIRTTATLSNGAASGVGTLTNAPSNGNPTKWISIDDNGTTRQIPAW